MCEVACLQKVIFNVIRPIIAMLFALLLVAMKNINAKIKNGRNVSCFASVGA